MNLVKRYETILTILKQTGPSLGHEYTDEELEYTPYDVLKIEKLLERGTLQNQLVGIQAMIEAIREKADPNVAQMAKQGITVNDPKLVSRFVRRLDALVQMSKRPGNFKVQKSLTTIGEKLYSAVIQEALKGVDPKEIVRLRQQGIIANND